MTASQHPIELILMKQLASCLGVPIFVVNASGDLVFFNEPAEALLGYRYEESSDMDLDHWGSMFAPTDEAGAPVPPDRLPLALAIRDGRPVQGVLEIRGLDSVSRTVAIVAFPLQGQGGRLLGAAAIFWEHVNR